MIFRSIKDIITKADKSDNIHIVTVNDVTIIKNIDLELTFNPTDNTMTIEDKFKTPSTYYLFNIDFIVDVKVIPSKSKRIPQRMLSMKSQSIDPVAKVGEI